MTEERDAELAAYLYGELDPQAAAALRADMERDPALATRWREAREAAELLDAWRPEVEVQSSPATRGSRHAAGWSAGLVGLAAGLLAFLGLLLWGVEVERSEGRTSLHLGRGPSASIDALRTEELLVELEERLALRLESAFERTRHEGAERQREMLATLAEQRDEDLQALAGVISGVVRGAALEGRRTRAALGSVVSLVAFNEQSDRLFPGSDEPVPGPPLDSGWGPRSTTDEGDLPDRRKEKL